MSISVRVRRACAVVVHTAAQEKYGLSVFTCHVRECEDALVEAVSEQVLLELLQDGHTHTQGEGGISQQQCVPQMKDLVQGQDVCGMAPVKATVHHKSQAGTYE